MVFLRSRKVTGQDLTGLSREEACPGLACGAHRYLYPLRLLEVEPLPEENPKNWLDPHVAFIGGTLGFHGSGESTMEACQEAILKLACYIEGRLQAGFPVLDERAYEEFITEFACSGKFVMEKEVEAVEMAGRAVWKGKLKNLTVFADVAQGVVKQAGWHHVDRCWYMWKEPICEPRHNSSIASQHFV